MTRVDSFSFCVLLLGILHWLSPAVNGQAWRKATESPYGKDLAACKENWVEISKSGVTKDVESCYEKLLFAVVPRLQEPAGVPALKVATMEPFSVDIVSIGNSDVVRGNLTDLIIYGMTKGITPQHSTVTYDPVRKDIKLVVKVPEELRATSRYDVVINAGALFGQNEGSGTRTVGSLTAEVGGAVATVVVGLTNDKNGDLRVRSSSSSISADYMKLKFTEAAAGDPLSGFLNTAISSPESSLQLLEEIKPFMNDMLARSLGSLYHRGFKVLNQI